MLLIKTEDAEKAMIFLRPRDPLLETWNGRRLGVERAPQKLNVDEAYSIDDFKTEFPKLTEKFDRTLSCGRSPSLGGINY